ncbi:MAG: glutamyl-tRNA reductase [Chloroflexota bacterium]
MPFLTIGVEHSATPLDIREQIGSHVRDATAVPNGLLDIAGVEEAALLDTCNRVEVYLVVEDVEQALAVVSECLVPGELRRHLHSWTELGTVDHLFRVAAGLESQVLGEHQIMAQVRESLETARKLESVGPNLQALFQAAVRCGKRVRAGVSLGRMDDSLPRTAVENAETALGQLSHKSALLIGGGRVIGLAAEALRERGIGRFWIANRTTTRAEELAGRFGGIAARLSDIPQLAGSVDLIMSATGARGYVLTAEDVPVRSDELLIYDLAVPRDVDPLVGRRDQVMLHDLGDLLPESDQDSQADIRQAEAMIAAELAEFHAWYLTRRVVPVIANLRSHVEEVQRQELERVAPRLTGLTDSERATVESLTSRLIDKMFHHLVTRLRLAAQTDPRLVEAAEFFFLHGEGGLFPHALETLPEEQDARS